MKKSGLSDSPFFHNPNTTGQTVVLEQSQELAANEPIYQNADETEQMNGSANTQTHGRSKIQMSESSDEQMNKRTITRQSYNVFDDHVVTIDRIQTAMRQKKKKHVEKGHVVRMALDIALPKLLKKYSI